ncbi:hypothetical protein HXX76_004254 [Chlamydomonas incerta]|uniref:3-hydroxyisobutyryl-CoA hydrolase n=1 Tax=Chlamydomonas incerta TaxID=51695 RepID=A0A835W8Q9_CHLIN|nr:hypothetical protein HXX76_004254 [Chlamydomonas incerta]|eukprot:KAG2440141.1 hypothetical protein HXX76_004254 [Chlamydomonas incerta]
MRGAVAIIDVARPHSLGLAALQRLEAFNADVAAQTRAGAPMCVLVRTAAGGQQQVFGAEADRRELVRRARAGDPAYGMALLRAEYGNTAAISRITAPYVLLLDGHVSGGGMGVAVPTTFRVATERTVVSLPEVALGLFPDAGASALLQRLPGCLGRWLGLTGLPLTGAEVRDAGIATHLVPAACLPELESALVALGPRAADRVAVDCILKSFEGRWPPHQQHQQQLRLKISLINEHFSRGSVEAVVASLEAAVAAAPAAPQQGAGPEHAAAAAAFLRDTLVAMQRGSPLSQAVTWELLRRASGQPPSCAVAANGPAAAMPPAAAMGINACNGELTGGSTAASSSGSSHGSSSKSLLQVLELEYVAACRCMAGQGDFYEGVRAGLIDRDGRPAWRYGSVSAVPAAAVHGMFEPLPGQPLLAPQLHRDWSVGAYPQWPVWPSSRL